MYSVSFINANFRIKIYGVVNGKRMNKLVGVSGLLDVLGNDEQKLEKYVTRSLRSQADKTCSKIYGGAMVTFYVK